MAIKKRRLGIGFLNLLLFFTVLLLHYTVTAGLHIGKATPLAILPLLTAFSMFAPVSLSALTGFFTGLTMDGIAGDLSCFNTLFLMLAAALISALADNLFNKNIRSAVVLSFLAAVFYFFFKWLCFYAFRAGMQDSLTYLLYYAIPSILYTEVFIFAFYPLYRRFDRMKGA